jgi:hypothetical protein
MMLKTLIMIVTMYKVIIAGGRDFSDYELLDKNVYEFTLYQLDLEIVSGCANGADKLGEKYANTYGIPIKRFPADWDKHGKSAGYIRNKQMAEYADMLIAFWDGKSKGTNHMIDLATNSNLKIHIINYGNNRRSC